MASNSPLRMKIEFRAVAQTGAMIRYSWLLAFGLVVALQSYAAGQSAGTDNMFIAAPFPMDGVRLPAIPQKDFDIRHYGAVEGGDSDCTAAFRKVIYAASKSGGGRIVVPAGIWHTGAIVLENNIDLNLQPGAEIRFSQDPDAYLPVVFSRHEDIECYKYSSFIYANGKKNIAITGSGVLNGQGKPWWEWKTTRKAAEALLYEMGATGVPVEKRIFDGKKGKALRPAFFQPIHCQNILVEGVTFRDGAFWTIAPTYCQNVVIRNVTVVTAGENYQVPNGDGVDVSSCKDVLIEGCDFDTGDDCVAIKSGRDNDGLRVNRPTENVVIRNCRGRRGHGGIVVGSETSGGIRNIFAEECSFSGTDRIVRIKTARGRGGEIREIWFNRLSGENIRGEAILVTMLYSGSRLPTSPVGKTTPRVRDISFRNITSTSDSGSAVVLEGLPERPLAHLSFDSIQTKSFSGIRCSDADSVTFSHASVKASVSPLVDILDSHDIDLRGISTVAGAQPLAEIRGQRSGGIVFSNIQQREARSLFRLAGNVREDAVAIADTSAGSGWSRRIADAFLSRHPGAVTYDKASPDTQWNYEQGLMFVSLLRLWHHTGDTVYLNFVKRNLERYIGKDGSIRTYQRQTYNLDNVAAGRALLEMAKVTGEPKYRWAADTLRAQLRHQPRTEEGGFWHKKIYPYQMWLDGLFMAEPFYARYSVLTGDTASFDDIANQFVWIARHTRHASTGLFYHGWDEKKVQPWADSITGCSPSFWGRAIGWYMMALVDVLDDLPAHHPQRPAMISIFQDLSASLLRWQDSSSGLWYQVIDKGNLKGNYLESSASCMFAYAFAKGSRKGYLDNRFRVGAAAAFTGILQHCVSTGSDGLVQLHDVCRGAGLGGQSRRSGTFDYYIAEPRRTDDMKGIGAWILAAIEFESFLWSSSHNSPELPR